MVIGDVGRNDEDRGGNIIAAADVVDADGEANAIADGIAANVIGQVDQQGGHGVDNDDRHPEAARLHDDDDEEEGDDVDENGEEMHEENLVNDGEDENPPLTRMNAINELVDVEYEDILDGLHDERIKGQFTISKTSSFMESMIKLRVATPANVVEKFLSIQSTDYQIDYPTILEVVSNYGNHHRYRNHKLSFFVETMTKMMHVGASSKYTVKKDFKSLVGFKEETQTSILSFFETFLESEQRLFDPLFFRVFDEVECDVPLAKLNLFDLFTVMSLVINLFPWEVDDNEYFEEEIASVSKMLGDSLRWRDGRIVEINQSAWLDVDIVDDFPWACPADFDRLEAIETLSVCNCTSLVSLHNLSKLELHRCPIQDLHDDLRFQNLKHLIIDHGFQEVNQTVRIATQEVSPVLERLDLSCTGSEDLDAFLTMIKTSNVSETLKYIVIEARNEDGGPCVKERHLLSLLCEIVPKLNDKCIVVVKGLRYNTSFLRLSTGLRTNCVSNLKHLYLSAPKVLTEEELNAVESIARICTGFFLFDLWEFPYWKFNNTYKQKVYVQMAGNKLLKSDDETQFELDGVPLSLWPRILERADNHCCPKCIEHKLFGINFQSTCTCSRVHSGLYHLIRHGPALSSRIELSSPKPTPVRKKRDLASYHKRLKQPKLTAWFEAPQKKPRKS